MAAIKKTRLKTAAASIPIPQTRDECAEAIKRLGDTQRRLARAVTEMNDAIAAVTEQHQPVIDATKLDLKTEQDAIKTYCEAHREELTGGKSKTANLITGEVQWRQRPPSISIRGVESVIVNLKRLGLSRFVRTKEEPNKEAMLNEPELAATVAGITVVTGVEDFVITPFEQDIPS